jgi:hypothetical protein
MHLGRPLRTKLKVRYMDAALKQAGVTSFNVPKKTPNHPTKSHVVVIKQAGKVKTIRFGQQGVTGDKQDTPRRRAFIARHARNIAKGPTSAAYWSFVTKW